MPTGPALRAGDSALCRFLQERHWVIDLDEWRARPEHYDGLELPPGQLADVLRRTAAYVAAFQVRLSSIVAEMNARGVTTREAGRFHIATVQRILARAAAADPAATPAA